MSDILKDYEFYVGTDRGGLTSLEFALFHEKTARLTISAGLAQKLSIQNWEFVLLAFNQKKGSLALKQCELEQFGAHKFIHAADRKSKNVSLHGFIKFFEIKNFTRKYKPTKKDENTLLLEPVKE